MTATSRGSGTKAGSPLFWRLFLASAAIVVTVLAIALLMLALSARQAADTAVTRGLNETRRLVAALLEARERALTSGALVFAQNPTFRALLLEQQPEDLLDQAMEATERTRASWVQITNAEGVRLAKSDEPSALPLELGATALVRGALAGEPVVGTGIAGDTALFQGVAVPVVGATAVAGVLMAVLEIDSLLARDIEQSTASDIVFFLLEDDGTPRSVASTIPSSADLDRFLGDYAHSLLSPDVTDETRATRAEVTIDGEQYVGQGDLLHSAGGEPLGGFIALRSRAEEMAPFTALRDRIVFAGAFGLVLASVLSLVLARGITRPILDMAEATRRAAAGDLAVADVRAQGGTEVGELADAVRAMLTGLQERDALASIARDSAIDAAPSLALPPEAVLTTGALAPGMVISGRYRILHLIGVGGSGVVYKAMDDELGEPIAIKTLRRDVVLDVEGSGLERLRSEIRLARRITHVNVVRIHDIGEAGGVHFITMEHVAGTPLDRLIAQHGRLPVPATLSIGRQLCRALVIAHEQGIIHRDIKPQNLIVQPDGVLKVMDFGIARLVRRSTVLTAEGAVVGTPAYMAPEQLLDEDVDERVDVYAAGVVLYECVTGRRPLDASSPAALIGRLLSETPPRADAVEPSVPQHLASVIERAMARDRNARPESAAALLDALRG